MNISGVISCPYFCVVKSCRIPKNIDVSISLQFSWDYRNWESSHIQTIHFIECDLDEIPKKLTRSFPNLKTLIINNSKLKTITKDDLTDYKKFTKIDLSNNEIDYLPGDLFEGFENLETINFDGNKLSVIEPNILDGLDKLKCVKLNGSEKKYESFDVKFAVRNFDREMIEIKKNLMEQFCSNIKSCTDYIFNLQSKFEALKKSSSDLTEKAEEVSKKLQIAEVSNEVLKKAKIDMNIKIVEKEDVIKNLTQQLQNLEIELKNIQEKSEQQNIQNFCMDVKAFTQDESTKDFKIQIEDHEFPVHKFLLAARSPTLAGILKNNPEVENLNLVDISVDIFEIILKFLYNGELPNDDSNFLHLFAAAGKLKIKELKNYAASKLLNIMDAENVLEIFSISSRYEHDELKLKAFAEIKAKYPKIDIKDEWIDDIEKIEKLIKFFKKMEEAEKSLQSFMMSEE